MYVCLKLRHLVNRALGDFPRRWAAGSQHSVLPTHIYVHSIDIVNEVWDASVDMEAIHAVPKTG